MKVELQMHIRPERVLGFDTREPPKTAFRSWVDGGRSVFGVDGFIAAPCFCIFMTLDPLWLIGFRSYLVIIFAFSGPDQIGMAVLIWNRDSERARLHDVTGRAGILDSQLGAMAGDCPAPLHVVSISRTVT
mgnify:CR=1 FL=1